MIFRMVSLAFIILAGIFAYVGVTTEMRVDQCIASNGVPIMNGYFYKECDK